MKNKSWKDVVINLIEKDFVSWKDVASLVLSSIHPPQICTSIGCQDGFKKIYKKGDRVHRLLEWLALQDGKCKKCGTTVDIQVDHIVSTSNIGDYRDDVSNLQLLCRRCNSRKSKKHMEGKTSLTQQAMLTYIVLSKKPKTVKEYQTICKRIGIKTTSIRLRESLALLQWMKNRS